MKSSQALWSANVQWFPCPVYKRREVKKTAEITTKAEAKIPVAPEQVDKTVVDVMLYPGLQIHALPAALIVAHIALVMHPASAVHDPPTLLKHPVLSDLGVA